MNYFEIITKLKNCSNPKSIEEMARFGINPKYALGVNIPTLRKTAKEIKKSPEYKNRPEKLHKLAQQLWNSRIHEVRILASMIDVPELVSEKQMDNWIKEFNSWDLCDEVCMNLFDKTEVAYHKAVEWSKRKSEFEKRSGFALMACLVWHDKKAPDSKFINFFPYIKKASTDERNFVRKAVNWALRQIGKRSLSLREESKKLAKDILKSYPNSKSAKWIANDAIRELSRETVKKRLE
ncbi:DNA alkylation repair protein [Candidatus Woesebacteria bacterium RBG_16_34_12]|uniref:DNA alkylation repair protein n=1 Tax=Candidatus Woesebacteria bacterium RBG_16_34_12 TaxID=1802480 RepID=A0A1F7X9F6_9BACT|nr:MAG: DNA alkylation repair protein [Candidatus Woesebacteria bacterium RBG_16_34_12]